MITEFLASNDRGLPDIDGDSSDWIEIYNPDSAAINLQGYKLISGPTDDPNTRTEWTFPSTPLAGKAYAIVYASGKVPAPAGQPLHTPFKLSVNGEYLGLADPSGKVVSEYAPGFPEQRTDISYGRASSTIATTTYLTAGTSLRTTVPANANMALDWTNRIFDDSTWSSGTSGVGFEINAGTALSKEVESNDTTATANDASGNFVALTSNYYQLSIRGEATTTIGADFYRIGALDAGDLLTISAAGVGSVRGTMANSYLELYRLNNNLSNPTLLTGDDDSGPGGNTDALLHRFTITANDTYFVKVRSVADAGGIYDLALWLENTGGVPDTSGNLTQETEPNDNAAQANDVSTSWRAVQCRSRTSATAGTTEDFYKFLFTAGNLVTVNLDSTGAAGAMDLSAYLLDSTGQVIASDDGTSTAVAPYSDDAAIYSFRIPATGTYYVQMHKNSGAGSPVYNADIYLSTTTLPPTQAMFTGLIKTNVQAQMLGKNASAYVRIPFHVDDVGMISSLMLRMKYDDGFAAYINGELLATRNAPNTLAYNSAATGTHDPSQAIVFEDIDIIDHKAALAVGDNVLAIQGLNIGKDDYDFLILPELISPLTTPVIEQYYYTTPTPGKPNQAGALGLVADTKFDHDRGFYDTPFDLTITTMTEQAQIRYTLDGKAPTATTGTIYTTPIHISATTTIRAAAFKAGYVATNVDAQTYLFLDDVIRQSATGAAPTGWPSSWGGNVVNYGMDPDIVNNVAYKDTIKNDLKTIPSFSIVMDLNDLFNPSTGIYANPGGEGRAWERPMSVELIYPDGKSGFQENGGIRIRGGYSRSTDNPKHAFRFFFRDEYGDGKLKYPVFGPDGPSEFDCFDLRTFQNYSWSFGGDPNGVFIRDVFSRDTQLAMGSMGERGDYYHLYINGQYWGLYNTCERPEASWAATYLGGTSNDYDVIKVEAGPYTINATDGDMAAWTRLWSAAKAGLTTNASYFKIQGRNPDGTLNPAYENLLDIDNLIDYMLVIEYGGNLDAPISNFLGNTSPNNFYGYRKRDGSMGFRFVAHDSEHTLLNANENRMGPYSAGSTLDKSNPQWLWQQAMANAEFRLKVADRAQKAFFNGGVFYVDPLNPKWDPAHPERNVPAARFIERKNEIDRAVVGESARWGDSKTHPPLNRNTTWVNVVNNILNNFFPQRSKVVLGQLKAKQLYPSIDAPTFSQFGGVISKNFALTISAPAGTIYYTLDGSDPRLLGGAVAPGATVYSGAIPISQTTNVKARVLSGVTWSAMTDATFTLDMSALRITELMYNPPVPGGSGFKDFDFEFIELRNTSALEIDLLGIKFTNGIDFVFDSTTLDPADRNLPPGQRIVVVKNKTAFQSRYGNTTPDGDAIHIAGPFDGKLDNAGDTIRLEGPLGQLIEEFTYKNTWFPLVDGGGFSMVAVNPSASNAVLDTKDAWRPSSMPGGAPGAADPGLDPDSIVINEIMSNPLEVASDWVEIRNTTGNDIDISAWFVSNLADNLEMRQLPTNTIVPKLGYYVLTQAALGFAFSELSDHFYISSNYNGLAGGYQESTDFGTADSGVSFGRYNKSSGKSDFVAMSSPTPEKANAYPLIGPVVINELMYHPVAGKDEYIELKNTTGSPVKLYDPAHPENAWKFTSGIAFGFKSGDEIPADGYALVVPIDPLTFRAKYDIPAGVPIFGPYIGVLNGAGEPLELSKPAQPQGDATVPYVLVERIKYDNKTPWPTKPDGTGPSLGRLEATRYGNDSVNWMSDFVGGTPGNENRGQVMPVLSVGAATGTIGVGYTFSRNGSFVDPNEGQIWIGTVDWDEGNGPEPLTLNADQTFKLSHVFTAPGMHTVVVTVTDNLGGAGVASIVVSAVPSTWYGTNQADSYTLRLDPTGTYLQFFQNLPTTGDPSFALKRDLVTSLVFLGGNGDDVLTIDMSNGSPIPTNGVVYDGGTQNVTGDLLRIRGNATLVATFFPNPNFTNVGLVNFGNREVSFTGVESLVVDGCASFTLSTQNDVDNLAVDSPGAGQTRISGTSGSTIVPVDVSNSGTIILDVGSAEVTGGDDTITISGTGLNAAKSQALVIIVGVGNNSLIVNGGTTLLDTTAGAMNLGITVNNAAAITLATDQELASLTINDSGRVNIASSTRRAMRVRGLSISGQGLLDVGSGDLIVQGDPQSRDLLYKRVQSYIASARSGGSNQWRGAGITSSGALANGLTGLAALFNDRGGNSGAFYTYFDYQIVDANCILVKYTWNGDATLDGMVNASDYFLIDSGYITQAGGHYNGDFNYDGTVNADDYFLIDSTYIGQGSRMSETDGPTPLPELAQAQMQGSKQGTQSVLAELFSTKALLS